MLMVCSDNRPWGFLSLFSIELDPAESQAKNGPISFPVHSFIPKIIIIKFPMSNVDLWDFGSLPTELSLRTVLTWFFALAPIAIPLAFAYHIYKSITKCKDPEPDEKLLVENKI